MNNLIAVAIVRVSSYLRTSTDRQERDETIKTQRATIKRFLDSKYGPGNYEIVAEYADDGYTGTNMNRPMLQQMLQDSQTDKWDVLVAFDSSRLSRDFSDGITIVDNIMQAGKQIIYTDGTSPNGRPKLLNRVMAAVDDDDRERTIRKFLEGKKNRASQGRIMNSVSAYGYTLIPKIGWQGRADYKDTQLVINSDEAEVVKLIFHLVGNERYSARQVIKKLMELGIKPRKSTRGIWASSSIYNMLNNEVYIGNLRYASSIAVEPKRQIKRLRKKNIEKTSRIIKPRSEWQIMKVPAILEGQEGVLLFQRAQEQLRRNKREAKGNRDPHSYLLSGRIECTCGYARCGEGAKATGNLYYRCSDRVSNFPLSTCEIGGIRAIDSDEAVWKYLSELVTTPSVLQSAVEDYLSGSMSKPINEAELSLNVLRGEEEVLLKARSRLETAMQRGSLDYERFEVLNKENNEKLVAVKAKLGQLLTSHTAEEPTIADPYLAQKIVFYAQSALRDMSFKDKRQFVLDTVTKVVAVPGELRVEGALPLVETWSYDAIILPLRQNKAKIPSPFYYVQFKTISGNCRPTKRR